MQDYVIQFVETTCADSWLSWNHYIVDFTGTVKPVPITNIAGVLPLTFQ